jgi:hypothetical protein
MSRFDKTELEGVIESMEKLLKEETAPPPSEPVAQPSVVPVASGGVAGALKGSTRVPESVRA